LHPLHTLGWSPFFEAQFHPFQASGLVPARVVEEQRSTFRIATAPDVHHPAELTGKLRRDASLGSRTRPGTGDWVAAALSPDSGGLALIHHVLERRTCFSRQEAGTRTAEQVIAANVDTVFLVQSLNQNFNVRRIGVEDATTNPPAKPAADSVTKPTAASAGSAGNGKRPNA